MLKLYISPKEGFNNKTNEFVQINGYELCLEHSLVSISKWESKWHKPFIGDTPKTDEELRDYIRCMTISQNIPDSVYANLSVHEVKVINDYIGDSNSATTFSSRRPEGYAKSKEIVTSELIYYWMVAYQIPFECQRWHLNRLLTLVRICSIKNNTGKDSKMPKRSVLSSNAALNKARRAKYGSKG